MRLSDSLELSGKSVSYYPKVAKALSFEAERLAKEDKNRERRSCSIAVTATIFFCSLIWRDNDRDISAINRDAFVKTLKQICDETGLSFKQAKAAKEFLEETGIVITKYLRLDHETSFQIQWEVADAIMERWEAWAKKDHASECCIGLKGPSPQPKKDCREGPKRTVASSLENTENKEEKQSSREREKEKPLRASSKKRSDRHKYSKSKLHYEQEIVAFMEDTARQAGKHWKHASPPGTHTKGNMGPTGSMIDEIKKEEKQRPERFRSRWFDFLRSPESDTERFPYAYFLNIWWNGREYDAMLEEERLRHIAEDKKREEVTGLPPGVEFTPFD